MRLPLHPHPDTPCPIVDSISVDVVRAVPGRLMLTYGIAGRVDAIRWPVPAAPVRTDGLWRHTCCEAFLRGDDGEGYLELNLSPSTAWAAWRFDSYRRGMRAAGDVAAPAIRILRDPGRVTLRATLTLGDVATRSADAPLRLALSVVIETIDGRLSYWALAHPPGRPDFHHADGFAAALPPGTAWTAEGVSR
ncbi:DOMON-like domain-containing protein [Rhodoplanes azumiensis]|uniref:DOMON-like domain-containing protein n=1 Tax=Rhodoplanes azumiensis TaxID=1897628 RepID=A0ABW5AG96_9BRAD